MAIILDIPGLEVAVLIDGEVAPEFDDPNPVTKATKQVDKYIESSAGSNSSILLTIDQDFEALQSYDAVVSVKVDGIATETRVLTKRAFPQSVTIKGHTQMLNGSLVEPKFQFSSIKTVEKQTSTCLKASGQLGTIVVSYFRGIRGARSNPNLRKPKLSGDQTVTEKQLKGRAISHKVELAKDYDPPTVKPFYVMDYVDDENNSYAEFKFRYGSREDLHRQLITPRPPSPILDFPVVKEIENEKIDHVEEQLRKSIQDHQQRVQKLQEQLNRRGGIKRNYSAVHSSTGAAGLIKHTDSDELTFVESRPVKRRCVPTADDQVVDLD